MLSHARLFAPPRTVACQAPLSMGIFQARILEWVAISFSKRNLKLITYMKSGAHCESLIPSNQHFRDWITEKRRIPPLFFQQLTFVEGEGFATHGKKTGREKWKQLKFKPVYWCFTGSLGKAEGTTSGMCRYTGIGGEQTRHGTELLRFVHMQANEKNCKMTQPGSRNSLENFKAMVKKEWGSILAGLDQKCQRSKGRKAFRI